MTALTRRELALAAAAVVAGASGLASLPNLVQGLNMAENAAAVVAAAPAMQDEIRPDRGEWEPAVPTGRLGPTANTSHRSPLAPPAPGETARVIVWRDGAWTRL